MTPGTAILRIHDPHQESPPLPIFLVLGHARCCDNLSTVVYRVTCWCSRADCADPAHMLHDRSLWETYLASLCPKSFMSGVNGG